jgi:TPR repeat protein
MLLNQGIQIEANPNEAVSLWLKCIDDFRHIQATYELATACYLGEGVPENAEMAVHLFRRAAHLGHAGAAYMLGECLLCGAGVERDRANALEWLVTAAELGHFGARDRVLIILNDKNSNTTSLDAVEAAATQRKLEEEIKWMNIPEDEKLKAVNIERRYTIGDANNMERRKTIVSESRGEA